MMLQWLRRRHERHRNADKLYGAVVTQAREPAFYERMGVPDSFEGRYEMIVLGLFVLLERLAAVGEPATELSRRTIERFVTDMDDCMREIGVGDLTVPKKVRRAAAGFYERAAAYRTARADGRAAFAAAITKAFADIKGGAPALDAAALADYAESATRELQGQPDRALLDGLASFPQP